jgi:hypothetical protein
MDLSGSQCLGGVVFGVVLASHNFVKAEKGKVSQLLLCYGLPMPF